MRISANVCAINLNQESTGCNGFGLNDSEGIAKRVMLFGTALLPKKERKKERKLKPEKSEMRNFALVLGHFLKFARNVKEMCLANEDGWKDIVRERANHHRIKSHMISINHVINEIRTGRDHATSDENETLRPETGKSCEGRESAAESYESKPWVGIITLESLGAGVKRS